MGGDGLELRGGGSKPAWEVTAPTPVHQERTGLSFEEG